MKAPYTVSQVRERLSEALDEAERGSPVVIERRGVRYRLTLDEEKQPKRRRKREPMFEYLDPAVAAGQWRWDYTPGQGLTFVATRAEAARGTKKR